MNNKTLEQITQEWQTADEILTPLQPAISIFGSARLPVDAPEYHLAENIAYQLSNAGFTILSGGGPSIMEAANKGAHSGKQASVGLNIVLPHEQHPNPYQEISLNFQYFSSRKAAFIQHAKAFIVFAGGLGTLDELFDTLTQIQTQKITRRPIILVGTTFWQGLILWMETQLLARGLIHPEDRQLLQLLDDPDEIVKTIIQSV